jgi:ubiquinone/menaquinone biosynthesis C-methylase UbiE
LQHPRGKQANDLKENYETQLDVKSMDYHLNQYRTQKASTLLFAEFIRDYVKDNQKIIDLGTGAGAALSYLASVYKNTTFLGIDLEDSLIEHANQNRLTDSDDGSVRFETGDVFNLKEFESISPEGVISLQALSWLSDYKQPMEQVYEVLKPKWIAVTSLFYEGWISAKTVITEHKREKTTFYNTICLPEFEKHANDFKYKLKKVERFDINIDLPKPIDSDFMGTYTKTVSSESRNERLQISGPLLMNWYSVSLVRVSN